MVKNLCKVVMFITIIIFGIGYWSAKPIPLNERPVERIVNYTIQTGDTAWHIAGRFMPDNADVREYITEVERLNGRKLSQLAPGTTIVLPVYKEEESK